MIKRKHSNTFTVKITVCAHDTWMSATFHFIHFIAVDIVLGATCQDVLENSLWIFYWGYLTDNMF